MNGPRNLSTERHLRSRPETKAPDIFIKPLLTQSQTDLRRADIRGLRNNILHAQHPVWLVVTQQCLLKPELAMLAVETVGELHQVLIQCRRNDHDLKRRTRLDLIANDPVAQKIGRRFARLVRIIIWQRCHRQNFSGLRSRDDR